MNHARIAALALALAATAAAPAHALKITTWNLLQYPSVSLSARQPHFRTVMQNLDTDLLMVQELQSPAGADSFLKNVLKVVRPNRAWKSSGFLSLGSGEGGTVFYDSLVVGVNTPTSVFTGGPRNVYQLLVSPRGYNATSTKIRLYSVHFKAGNPAFTPSDSTTRRLECTNLRNFLNNAPANSNILMGGDTNFYGDWEGGYIVLTGSQLDNDGRLEDAYSMPGTWNQFGYRCLHTESPCLGGCLSAGGGLDDRFDLFLMSHPLRDGEGLDLIGTTTYGNDCNHYNENIDQDSRNDAVPLAVATALRNASDHIPVVATFQLPAKVSVTESLDFGAAIVDGVAQQPLVVANGAAAPADELDYSLSATSGFGAPAGSFVASAGVPGNTHLIEMNSPTPGEITGQALILSDDPDAPAQAVALTGFVVGHAAASLDSSSQVLVGELDFGMHPQGGFRDSSVRVHDAGWNSLQAWLSLDEVAIAGGAGRFSLAGKFESQLIGPVGRTFAIHFDEAGATLDSTYEATLTIKSSDEDLPGALPQPDLVVTLRAQRVATTDAPADASLALRFLPARPNPLSRGTDLAFELPAPARVSLDIYDLSGRRVRSLVSAPLGAGRHQVHWDAADASGARVGAGLYFARFTTAEHAATQRLIVMP